MRVVNREHGIEVRVGKTESDDDGIQISWNYWIMSDFFFPIELRKLIWVLMIDTFSSLSFSVVLLHIYFI